MEIDDGQYEQYRRALALLNTLEQKGGLEFKKLVKKALPEVHVPEIDIAQPVIDDVAALRKELSDFRDGLKAEKEDGALVARFSALKSEGWTEEGIDKIKQTMVDRKIPDVDAAVALFEKQNPKPAPVRESSYTPQRWNFASADDEDKSAQLLLADEEAWADNEVASFMNELEKQQAE